MVTASRNDIMRQALAIKRSNNMRRNHKKFKFIRVNKAMENVVLVNPPVDLLFIIQNYINDASDKPRMSVPSLVED